ncbi:MAG TPA: pentapeptide repeat-containing protein [Candidatus Tidjanibacter gallistercoris]|nr:pentapeptide repeat-containing protein [Candidatus Tidjanibacter gallistercoris]
MEKTLVHNKTFRKETDTAFLREGTVCDGCTFDRCTVAGRHLNGIVLLDCRFDGCDFSLSSLAGTVTDGVAFSGCKMTGVAFGERSGTCRLSASFAECILDNALFQYLEAPRSMFRHCRMRGTVFDRCMMKETLFEMCDMHEASFSDCDLTGTDFLTSDGFTLDPETNRLRGARFAVASLPGLLAKYRIKTEEYP